VHSLITAAEAENAHNWKHTDQQNTEQAQILEMKRCEVTAFVNKNDGTLLLKRCD